jgi:hypothetical protein
MTSNKDNGIALAEEFRKAAERTNPPERVVLPKSGLAVLLRRPTTFAVWMLDQRLAELQSPVASGQLPEGETGNRQPATGNYVQWRDTVRRAVEEAMVQPKLSLTPGPNEIHPSWLPEEDQVFVLRWVRGLIGPDGTDLVEKFFRESGGGGSRTAPTDPGAGGGDLALSAERSAGS